MIGCVAERVSSPVLVGRDAEAAQLRAALARAAAGEPAIVVVAGEAGVGKSRLVAELLRHAGESGAVTLTGGCLNVGEGVLAYAPMVEALRPLAHVLDPEELERVLGGARGSWPGWCRSSASSRRERSPRRRRPGCSNCCSGCCTGWRSGRRCCCWWRTSTGPTSPPATCSASWSATSAPASPWCSPTVPTSCTAAIRCGRVLAELERSARAERLELGRLGRRELADLLAAILGEAGRSGAGGGDPGALGGQPVLRRGAALRLPGGHQAAAGPA
jgi:hypothetical protein